MIRRTTWRARLLSVATGPLILYGCATRTGVLDADTARGGIAADLGRRTGFGVVIASGLAIESDTRERAGRRYQVNRPMEGVPGRPPSEEVATDCAREVYDAYEARVREVAR